MLAIAAGCNGDGKSGAGDPGGGSGGAPLEATFRSIQDKIFGPSCTGCHIGFSAPKGLRFDEANSFGLLVGVASDEVPSLLRVDPGNPDDSYLIRKLEGTHTVGEQMPPDGAALAQADINMIRQWITDGAQPERPATPPTAPVRITSLSPLPNSALETLPAWIMAMFDRDLDAASVNTTTFLLERSGGDGTFGDGNEVAVAAASVTVSSMNSRAAVLDLDGVTSVDDLYRVRLIGSGQASILDLGGNALDGEFAGVFPSGNGTQGGNFETQFIVAAAQSSVPNLAGKVLTVNGPIDPPRLGETLMHEHIFIDFKDPPPMVPAPTNISVLDPSSDHGLMDFDESLTAILDFKQSGGGTIVDVSNFGLTRDPLALKRVSRASGLNVVMGAGWYMKQFHPPDMDQLTVEQLTDIVVRDITVGAQGTSIRAGIIGEVGVVGEPLTDNELKSVRASARAARITGAPMSIHNFEPLDEMMRILDIIESEGVDLHRVVMSHTGGRDISIMNALFARGVYVEWDYMAQAPLPPEDATRIINSIAAMINAGHADQIMISHDICTHEQLKKNGGGGYTYIDDVIIPGLKEKGISDAAIHQIMYENPRRLLAFVAPQPPVSPVQ